jgi:D-aminoacyl-tRNA deacylase
LGETLLERGAMRAVVQRVTRAEVRVDGDVVGDLSRPGLVVLLGVTSTDTAGTASALATKVWQLRILRDEKSASDIDAPLLVVSQFTLYGDTRKGRRPSWSAAAPGPVAQVRYDEFCAALRRGGATVETGRFGADMAVELVNDGPVTVILEA